MYVNPVNILLRDKGMTQESLAKTLRVTRVHLNKVINDQRASKILKHRIAKQLDKTINELWPNEGRAPRAKASP